MLARKPIPDQYKDWNKRHHAPYGRRRGRKLVSRLGATQVPLIARYFTPYAWQPNNSIRQFEYPWAYEQISAAGQPLRVLDVGAGMAGFQFTLAQAGHDVHAVDPGMQAKGKGWDLDTDFHATLQRAHRAPLTLWPTTIAEASFADDSFDIVLSISTVEHFCPEDLSEFVRETKRILKPDGRLILTADLFINIQPFTSRVSNRYGINVDIQQMIDDLDATLVQGHQSELFGFTDFNSDAIQSNLSSYLMGEGYPALAQCFVAQLNKPSSIT